MEEFKIMNEISDGKLYGAEDVVKADTLGCRDWLGISDIEAYEEYILKWHGVIKKISDFMMKPAKPGVKGRVHELFLQHFYETPYDLSKDFYPQIYARIEEWEKKREKESN